MLAEDAPLEVRGKDHPWVSRGGIKLDHGLDAFRVRCGGRGGARCRQLDRRVHRCAAEPGRGQGLCGRCRHQPAGVEAAAGSARRRPRADQCPRPRPPSIIPEPVDIIVCDASFIGLAKVLEAPLKLAKPGAKLVALVKPQFEAGREEVGKGGVVRDPAVHRAGLQRGQRLGRKPGLDRARHRAKPDHRARRQCRIPARRGQKLAGDCGDSSGRGGGNGPVLCAARQRRLCDAVRRTGFSTISSRW